jgi:hypothetical protein
MQAEAPNPNAKVRRKPHRMRPKHDEVVEALRRTGCFLGPAAVQIGVSRSNLQTMIRNSSRLSAAFKDLNENALDQVERSLWSRAIHDKDIRAAQIILNARARNRGYGPQAGDPAGMGDTTNLIVQVVVSGVESGHFYDANGQLTGPGGMTIEGSVIDDVRTEKLN